MNQPASQQPNRRVSSNSETPLALGNRPALFELTLVTGNPKKVEETQRALGASTLVRQLEMKIPELMPSDRMEQLRFRGPEYYPEIAEASALLKMKTVRRLLKRERIEESPGLTIEDTSFWPAGWDGYPGILASTFFNGPVDDSGRQQPNMKAPRMICEAAKLYQDHRALFITTFVTLEDDSRGNLAPVVRQGIAEGYVPATPRGNGWSFDVVFCPNPVEVASRFGLPSEAAKLSQIPDLKLDLPIKADSMGFLRTFAESPDWKAIWSPRSNALRQFNAPR